MATQQACKICESQGMHSLSDWLITAQSEGSGFEPGTTFWVCQPCLAGLMLAWVQEQQGEPTFTDPDAPLEEAVPEGPGVLEQIEAEDGKVTPAGSNGRRRKSEPPQEGDGEQVVEGSGQTETADVHE